MGEKTTNYIWDIGVKGKSPWWDEWQTLWGAVDLELYKRSKDLYMQGKVVYGSDAAGNLSLTSNPSGSGKINLGANAYFDELNTNFVLNQPSDGVQKIFSFVPADTSRGKFNITMGTNGFWPGDLTRENRIFSIGYNQTINIGQELVGEPSLSLNFETYWVPEVGNKRIEAYLAYTSEDGTFGSWPWLFSMSRTNKEAYAQFCASPIWFMDPANNTDTYLKATVGLGIQIYGAGGFYKEVNNQTLLAQMNAAGSSYVPVLKVNADNKIEFLANAQMNGTLDLSGRLGVTLTSDAGPAITMAGDSSNMIFLRGGTPLYYFDFWRSSSDGAMNVQGNQSGFNDIVLCPAEGNVRTGGEFVASNNGKGVILKNAAGTVQRRVRLNDVGDGLIFEAL